jgi:hypothetical protein
MIRMSRIPASLTTIAIIEATLAVAIFSLRPPPAAPPDAPPLSFSSGRAMAHVVAIAREPRPSGSRAHGRAREYLLGELRALGIQPEVQEGFVEGLHLTNVLARIRGRANTSAVLLAAHYDSVPESPGAADDASGVAVLLETLRAVLERGPLRNDLIALFTDGEEGNLLGARLFVEKNPLADRIGLVLNFEARGNGGPSIMFETAEGNGALIREFAEVARHPVANSLSYSVYQLLPNDTDLTIFKGKGLAGFNFAFIDGFSAYHRPIDDPRGLNERSLQHQGQNALDLTLHFGELTLPVPRERDVVYFDVLGSFLVRYPSGLVLPLAALISAFLIGLLVLGFRRRRLGGRGLVLGLRIFLKTLAEVALLPSAAGILLERLFGWLFHLPPGVPWRGEWTNSLVVVSLFNVALAVNLLRLRRLRGTAALGDLAAGALLAWLFLLWVSSLLLPGASFLFAGPLLMALPGLAYLLAADPENFPSLAGRALFCATSLAAVVLLAPGAYLLFLALAYSLPLAVLIACGVIQLCLGLLIPLLASVLPGAGRDGLTPLRS